MEQTEQAAAAEDVARWDKKLEAAMAEVEAAYEKNKNRWVDALFTMIVGVKP